jgi:hypothetical protein
MQFYDEYRPVVIVMNNGRNWFRAIKYGDGEVSRYFEDEYYKPFDKDPEDFYDTIKDLFMMEEI